MSGKQGQFPEGMGVVDEDMQRVADAASQADDRLLGLLGAPGGADNATIIKRVFPLLDELRTTPDLGGGPDPRFNGGRTIGCEAAYFGGAVGRVRVFPIAIQITAATPVEGPQAGEVLLTAVLEEATDTGAFASTTLGRVDTVYATVDWNVPALGTRPRRIKDTTTGTVTTEDTTVYREPRVRIFVAAGTEGSTTPGAVPADGGSSWNVKLMEVALPAPYTTNAILLGGSGSYIRQAWERGGVEGRSVKLVRPGMGMAFTDADAGLDATRVNSSRGSEFHIVRAAFRHTGATALVVLDAAMDWRHRMLRATILRTATQVVSAPYGKFMPPGALFLATGGQSNRKETGWVHTGSVADLASASTTAMWRDGKVGTFPAWNTTDIYPDKALVTHTGDVWQNMDDDMIIANQEPGVYAGWTVRNDLATADTMRLFVNSASGGGDPPVGALCLEIIPAPEDGANGGDHYVVMIEATAAEGEL